MKDLYEKLKKIKLFAVDCDGVMTDGGMYYSDTGLIMKKFNVLDGMGFILLKEQGIKTAIITGEDNEIIKKRAAVIKCDYLVCGTKDKLWALEKICEELHISIEEAVYMGDEIFDMPAIEKCGLGCAPADALKYAREVADYVAERKGGCGCVREIADMLLQAQKLF